MARGKPNVVITGTPGVGKTTLCRELASSTGLVHLDINKIVKENDCSDGFDKELDTVIVDEDKLLDVVEPILEDGSQIIDWHACDLFPEALIDLIVVVRCKTETLFDRLKARQYGDKKIEENMDAEIMEVILSEARAAYDERMVVEVWSDDLDMLEDNVSRLEQWVQQWGKDHPDGIDAEG